MKFKTIHSYLPWVWLILILVVPGMVLWLQLSKNSTSVANIQQWRSVGEAQWSMDEDGVISSVNPVGDGFLVSSDAYTYMHLSVEFWPDSDVNSGIFISCAEPDVIHPKSCYEVNIWDAHPDQNMRTGAVVLKAMPPLAHLNTVGRWNHYEITHDRLGLKVVLNGTLTAQIDSASAPAEGHIALQRFGKGKIRFRDLRIKTIN
jgi:hypothetical protein